MSLPSGWHLIRVYGQFLLINGQPAVGTISFRSDQQVIIGGVEVVPYVQTVTLDANGAFEIHLAATDDPNIAPTGWSYQATFDFSAGTPPDPFYFPVAWDGGDLNLVNARHVAPPAPMVSYLTTADIGAVVASQGSVVAAEADAQAALAECATQAQEIASLQAAQATALLQGNNLSDVADAATARTNLGVPAGSGTSTGTNTGDQDLSGYVPTSRTVNGHPLTANVTVTAADLGLGTASALTADTDGTLAANSDARVATQKATKTYVDTLSSSLTPGTIGTVQTVGDANATIAAGTAIVLLTAALTAPRTYTLPAASAYAAGAALRFADLAGGVTATNTATFARAGADTIDGGTTYVATSGYAQASFVTDGASKWTARGIREGIAVAYGGASDDGCVPVWSGANGLTLQRETVTPTLRSTAALTATLSSELVVDASWVLGTGWASLGGGQYQITLGAGTGTLAQNIAATSGTAYLVAFTIQHSVANNGTITEAIGAATGVAAAYAVTSTNNYQTIIIASATGSLPLAFALAAGYATGTITLSAISVKAITQTQSQSAVRRSDGTLEVLRGSSTNSWRGGGGACITTGSNNVASGSNAQYSLTTGSSNVASGSNAQYSLTTGSSNVASGASAQRSLTTGSNNVASGYAAQYSLTTGSNNVASGSNAQYSLTTGSNNIASGYYAQYSLTTGSNNVASGVNAQRSLTTGSNNVASGVNAQQFTNAGASLTTVSNSVCIGYDARQLADGDTNEVVIGYGGRGNGSNTTTIGNSSTTDTYLSGRVRAGAVVTPATYVVASLPTSGTPAGSNAYASNARKAGEGAGAGTGIPVWYDGTNWRTFYDNTVAAA